MANYAKKGKTFSHKSPAGQARKKAAEEMIKAVGEEHDAQFGADKVIAAVAPIAGTLIGGYFGGPMGAKIGGTIGGMVSGAAAGDNPEAQKVSALGKKANNLYGMSEGNIDYGNTPPVAGSSGTEGSTGGELFSIFNMMGN